MERRFRGILLASLILGLAGGLLDLVVPSLLPQPLLDAQASHEEAELSMAHAIAFGVASIVLVVGAVVALVGLWTFRRWAPRLAVGVTVLAFVVYPFLGHDLSSALASTLNEISATLWGVVLAMAFLPPLRDRFEGVVA
jgi:urea transporter